MKKNITKHGDSELSLMVFNDEGLYAIRHNQDLMEVLDDNFVYTEKQRKELEWDLEADLEESSDVPY